MSLFSLLKCEFYKKYYRNFYFSNVLFFGVMSLGAGANAHASSLEITGAGSSFAAPVYQAWSIPVAQEENIAANYQTIGSSAGQDQMIAHTVDFGASDKPMSADRLEKFHLYQFPTVVSGIVVIVNITGVPSGKLRLDGPTLADLYDGRITRWNDPKIQALNPDISLPNEEVAAVHRADGSGTTYVFTSYLSQISQNWKETMGAGTLVGWHDGAGARGNDGVAALVKQTEGSIGYVEYAFALQNHMNVAQLKNHDGAYIYPFLEGFKAATETADWNVQDHYAVNLLDQKGAMSWPIVTPTYVLVRPILAKQAETKAVYDFFKWGFDKGDRYNHDLGYVGIPENIKHVIITNWPHDRDVSQH